MKYSDIISKSNQRKPCGLCCTKIQNFGVSKGKVEILRKVNLSIHCGELTALIGPNGAGKSTLLKALLGEIPHTGELIFLDEKGAHTGSPLIGYVPQQIDFDRDTPTSVLDLFMACKTTVPVWAYHPVKIRKLVLESLSRVQAENLIDRRMGDLSGGEMQRVLLALALDPIPDILLLDEPVSGIDEKGLRLFYSIVSDLRRNYDLSIILVSHDLALVAGYADRVAFLNKTIECCGSPEEVFHSEEFIDAFGSYWAEKEFAKPNKSRVEEEHNR